MTLVAAVEGGGTTWVCVIADVSSNIKILERAEYPTEAPETTLGIIRDWLNARKFQAIGIATFGPVDARPYSSRYGFITSTPKPGWYKYRNRFFPHRNKKK